LRTDLSPRRRRDRVRLRHVALDRPEIVRWAERRSAAHALDITAALRQVLAVHGAVLSRGRSDWPWVGGRVRHGRGGVWGSLPGRDEHPSARSCRRSASRRKRSAPARRGHRAGPRGVSASAAQRSMHRTATAAPVPTARRTTREGTLLVRCRLSSFRSKAAYASMPAVHILIGLLFIAFCTTAHAAGRAENRFGSIYIDGKKAGQIHYTIEYSETGDLETLKTSASLSILGVKLFNFDQNLHEEWRRGQLQQLRGRTDDDGTIYE